MIKTFPKTLAIDWGTKKIGLAIGETPLGIRLLAGRGVSKNLIIDLKDLITEESVEQLLIGQQANDRLVGELKKQLRIPIIFEDEALTSEEVKRLMRVARLKPRSIDSRAAALLLEQYFLCRERLED